MWEQLTVFIIGYHVSIHMDQFTLNRQKINLMKWKIIQENQLYKIDQYIDLFFYVYKCSIYLHDGIYNCKCYTIYYCYLVIFLINDPLKKTFDRGSITMQTVSHSRNVTLIIIDIWSNN